MPEASAPDVPGEPSADWLDAYRVEPYADHHGHLGIALRCGDVQCGEDHAEGEGPGPVGLATLVDFAARHDACYVPDVCQVVDIPGVGVSRVQALEPLGETEAQALGDLVRAVQRQRLAEVITPTKEDLAVRDAELERLREENAYVVSALNGVESRREVSRLEWRQRAEQAEATVSRVRAFRDYLATATEATPTGALLLKVAGNLSDILDGSGAVSEERTAELGELLFEEQTGGGND